MSSNTEQQYGLGQAAGEALPVWERIAVKVADTIREYAQSFNQNSVNNEAMLAQGGYDPGVATALQASIGNGASPEAVEQEALAFALMAAQAVTDNRPLSAIRFSHPNLSQDLQEAIYAQVAQQQGKSVDGIEQAAKEKEEQAGKMFQAAVFGAAGAAVAQSIAQPQNQSFGDVIAALGGQFSPQVGLPDVSAGQDRGIFGR